MSIKTLLLTTAVSALALQQRGYPSYGAGPSELTTLQADSWAEGYKAAHADGASKTLADNVGDSITSSVYNQDSVAAFGEHASTSYSHEAHARRNAPPELSAAFQTGYMAGFESAQRHVEYHTMTDAAGDTISHGSIDESAVRAEAAAAAQGYVAERPSAASHAAVVPSAAPPAYAPPAYSAAPVAAQRDVPDVDFDEGAAEARAQGEAASALHAQGHSMVDAAGDRIEHGSVDTQSEGAFEAEGRGHRVQGSVRPAVVV